MDKQTRSRHILLALSALAISLTVFMNSASSCPAVSADGQNASTVAPFPTELESNTQQAIDLRRRPRVKVTGWIKDTDMDRWRLSGGVLRMDLDPLVEGNTDTDEFAVVIGHVQEDGQLHAESVSVRPLPGELGHTLEFRCLIQDIELRYWILCNRVVLITDSTLVQGQPEIGALAEVKAVRLTGGTVLARSIKVAAADTFAEVEFEGPIESAADDVWIVNGITVAISPVTVVRGVPEPGLTTEVKGILQPDGSVLAQSITVKGAEATTQVDTAGPVQLIEATYWQVGGTKIYLGPTTFIDDSRAPAELGMWAQVRALVRYDSSLLALRIRLSRPD